MFGISGEHILILGIILLIFGPKRLPELGNTLGKAMRNFKDAISGVEEAKFRRLEEERTAAAAKPMQATATTADATIAAAADPTLITPEPYVRKPVPSGNDDKT
jgi:TatA/E family protein of Tat protein translocase